MDNLVFEESINAEVSTSEFVDKQWLYVNDNNNSSYSSQIVLDTTPLANAGGYIGWMESFLTIPLVLQVESSAITTSTAPELDWFLGMKNGYWNILHSLTCEFNNGNIIQQVPFLNVFCSFKALTSWCDADIENWGAVCGFAPDTARSWVYNNRATASPNLNTMSGNGTGLSNNRLCKVVDITSTATFTGTPSADPIVAPYTPVGSVSVFNINDYTCCVKGSDDQTCWTNEGLKKRIEYLNFTTTSNTGTSLAEQGANKVALVGTDQTSAEGVYNAIFQSYIQRQAGYRAIVFDAVVRLKDVADFFNKCPLLKGSTMRLYLNTNQVFLAGSSLSAVVPAGSALTDTAEMGLTSPPVILGGGGTCPVMLSSGDIGQGGQPLAPPVLALGDPVDWKVGLSIVRTQFSQLATTITAPITSCRLYAPCYTMSPIAEQRYLSLTPTKKVMYNDIFQYSFDNIASGSPFNLLVSNGIPNIRSVLVVPLLAQAQNGIQSTMTGATANRTLITSNTLLSPFTTTGGTPDPIAIGNFNIQISGKNLFINNLEYNYEAFIEQLVSSNQLNGSLTTSLGSGQVSYEDFQSLYKYYYGNTSRSIPSEDGVAKAVQLLGTNRSPVPISLMVFVEFEREITIDVRTGARVM
jgi:hypothetical protein